MSRFLRFWCHHVILNHLDCNIRKKLTPIIHHSHPLSIKTSVSSPLLLFLLLWCHSISLEAPLMFVLQLRGRDGKRLSWD